MNKLRISISLCLWVSAGLTVFAQPSLLGLGADDWEYVHTEFFDVYYVRGNQASAEQVARFSEMARYELGNIYDFKPESRYTIVYSASPEALENRYEPQDDTYEGSPGIFPLPKQVGVVIHPGTTKGLYQEVKRNVSELILKEFTYGDRLGSTLQSQILLQSPEWFRKGLSDYVASGWTFEDEMWMNGVDKDKVLDLALEGEEHMNWVLRKSIWHYIAREYGEDKLSEIVYLINISNSIESGLISVIGITLSTLTQRWREHLTQRIDANSVGRTRLNQIDGIQEIPLRNTQTLTSFAYHEGTDRLALFVHHNGKHRLYLYHTGDQRMQSTPIHSGDELRMGQELKYEYPITWNPQGNQLATIIYRAGNPRMIYYDLENKTVSEFPLPGFQRILDMNWSHSGEQLAVSAIRRGNIDIFTTPAGNAALGEVTQDAYDDRSPVWSLDDDLLFFRSDRGNKADSEPFDRTFDIYKWEVGSAVGSVEAVTQTPEVDEIPIAPISSFELGYLSNASGIYNLEKVNIFLNEAQPLSNVFNAMGDLSISEESLVFASPAGGKERLYLASRQALEEGRSPAAVQWRYEYNQWRNKRMNLEHPLRGKVSTQPGEKVVAAPEPTQEVNEESEETNETKPRYYLFDEEDTPYEVKRPERVLVDNQRRFPTSVFGQQQEPVWEELELQTGGIAPKRWAANYIGMNLDYDPVAGYGATFMLGYTDFLNQQRLHLEMTPFFNLKNGDFQLKYENKRGILDLHASLGGRMRRYRQSSVFFVQDSLIFRFHELRGSIGASYPIAPGLDVGVELGAHHISRIDQKLLRADLMNQQDFLLRPAFRINYENVEKSEDYPYKGFAVQGKWDSYYSTEQSDFAIHMARIDIKNYLEIKNKIVLATWLRAGIGFDDKNQRFYMGGVADRLPPLSLDKERSPEQANILFTDLYDFTFQEFITPMRGFFFNTRTGTKYVMANFEVRIPLSRLTKQNLNAGSLYNLELIPFLDAGTVWERGNPFSQKNPTDLRVVGTTPVTIQLQTLKSPFLFSFGSGARMRLMGYNLRLDLAWGIDDNTVQKPVFTASFSKRF